MTRISLRMAALAAGMSVFEDQKGCPHGHTVFYSSTGKCKGCAATHRAPTFAAWARTQTLSPAEHAVAETAWLAAKGGQWPVKDRILRELTRPDMTAEQLGARATRHTRRLLVELEADGLVTSSPHADPRRKLWNRIPDAT